jgi:galactonate dehydratase
MQMATARRRARLRLALAPQAAVSPPATSSDLAIAEMRWFPLREPSGNRYALLRIKTRSGVTGWGECPRPTEHDAQAVEKDWLGKPATSYAAIDPASPVRAALDMAMLDVLGKSCRAPIYRVLGGPTRHKVRVFADSTAPGFRAIALAVPPAASRNQGKAFENQVQAVVQALIKSVPDNHDYILTAHGRLTPGDAASVARTVEASHPLWFDEPCSVSNLEAVRKISSETVTPLGFGRGIADPGVFLALLRDGLIDVVRPDLAVHGISGARQIAVMAEAYYVAIAPHHDGGPVATAAALHLAASVPNFFIQHVPRTESPADRDMRAAIVSAAIETPRDGFLDLPLAPGLGIEVNEAALEKYRES